jgi:hypothetical protein
MYKFEKFTSCLGLAAIKTVALLIDRVGDGWVTVLGRRVTSRKRMSFAYA